MTKTHILLTLFIAVILSGCAEVEIPTPKDIVTHPLGTTTVKRGMTKDQVRDLWGDPDRIDFEKIDKAGALRPREVWVYTGKYSAIPVDAGYLAKTKYVYFDGDNVTHVSEVDLAENYIK